MSQLICKHCGNELQPANLDWPWCHKSKTVVTYRCDGRLRDHKGWNEAKKAEPFVFNDYLKQCEDEVELL